MANPRRTGRVISERAVEETVISAHSHFDDGGSYAVLVGNTPPSAVGRTRVDVKVGLSETFLRYEEALHRKVNLTITTQGGTPPPMSLETLQRYHRTLIASRITWCRKAYFGGSSPVVRPEARVRHLGPVTDLLAGLGVVQVPEEGLTFVPYYDKEEFGPLLDAKSCEDIGDDLMVAEPFGFKFNLNYPKSDEGDLHLMAFDVSLDGKAVTNNRQTPIKYFVLATLFGIHPIVPPERNRITGPTPDHVLLTVRGLVSM